jgi:plasmid stability protein
MPKMIQIRHVPDRVHRRLKARAAKAGMSLSDYLLKEIERIAARPTLEEVLDRLSRLPPVELHPSPEEVIREERDRG